MKPLRFILIFLLILFASERCCSQIEKTLIRSNFNSIPLDEVLENWEKEYDLNFAYDSELLNAVLVSGNFADAELGVALSLLLNPTKLAWKLVRNTLVIYQISSGDSTTRPQQQNFSWSGMVRDKESGETLPYATVRLVGSTIGTTSDNEGRFLLQSVPSDTCSIVVSYIGYNDYRLKLTPELVRSGESLELKLYRTLLPQAIIYGEETQVVKAEKIASLVTMNTRGLAFIGSPGEPDILRMAQLLPGVDGTSESSNGLFVRGSDSDQTIVQLDGFTVYHLDHFFGVFSSFNPEAIKAMRIHKGALPASLGGRVGGLVELISKDGNSKKTTATFFGGMLTAGLCIESPLDKKGNNKVMVAVRRAFTDFLFSPVYKSLFNNLYNSSISNDDQSETNAFAQANPPDFSFYDITAKLSLALNKNNRLQTAFYKGNDALNISYQSGNENTRYLTDFSDEIYWGNNGFSAKWNHQKSAKQDLEIRVSFSNYFSSLNANDSITDQLSQVTAGNIRFEKSTINDFTLRMQHTRHISSHHLSAGIVYTKLNTNFNTNDVIQSGTNNQSVQANHIVLFVEDAFTYHSFDFMPGMRFGFYETAAGNLQLEPEPRLNVNFHLNDRLLLKSSAGRYVQTIQRAKIQSLYLNNADLWQLSYFDNWPALISDQLLAGIQYSSRAFTVDVEFYKKWNSGNSEYTAPFTNLNLPNNNPYVFGSGRIAGVDVLIEKNIRKHHMWFGYTLLDAFNIFDDIGTQRIPERFSQKHELKFIYQIKLDKWSFSLACFFGSGKPYTPLLGSYEFNLPGGGAREIPVYGTLNSGLLPAYKRVDLTAARQFNIKNAKCDLKFSIFNLLDAQNIRERNYYSLGNPDDPEGYVINQRDTYLLGISPSVYLTVKI